MSINVFAAAGGGINGQWSDSLRKPNVVSSNKILKDVWWVKYNFLNHKSVFQIQSKPLVRKVH